LLQIKRR